MCDCVAFWSRQMTVLPGALGLCWFLSFDLGGSSPEATCAVPCGTGERFEGGGPNAAEAMDQFVDEPGGVGAGVVAVDLALGIEEAPIVIRFRTQVRLVLLGPSS